MKTKSWRGAATVLLLIVAQAVTAADAADLKVLASTALSTVFEDLKPRFEKASGYRVELSLATSGALNKRIADGEAADLVISSDAGIEALIRDGKVVPESRTDIARSGMGIAVKAGAPKPDVATPQAFKAALLAAGSVAYTDPASGGASGINFAKALAKLGIAEQVRAKARLGQGGPTAAYLVTGEADLAIQQMSELKAVAGIDIVGPLPGELQTFLQLSAGLPTAGKAPDAARALVTFLGSPEAAAVIRDKGLEPDGADPAKGRM